MHECVERIRGEIARFGSIGFDRYMELALYGPGGFFASGRGAGQRGRDFVTSPEIGPLFGSLVARAIDREWRTLGEPDPFAVIECGAGSGRLARDVLRAGPDCAPALRYLLVEVSAARRAEQHELLPIEPADEVLGAFVRSDPEDAASPVERLGPIVGQLDEIPAHRLDGVVFANELLDNLPFAIAEWDGHRWLEVRVGAGLEPVLVPLEHAAVLAEFVHAPPGTRVPVPRGLGPWFEAAARALRRGAVIAIDYAAPAAEIVSRSPGWLRTYRDYRRGHNPFAVPGETDITADVVIEQVAAAARRAGLGPATITTQAAWLRSLGIDDLVAEGRRIWSERAHLGDLIAIEARSRATQAAQLSDTTTPGSLGNFTVWRVPTRD
jgi:SAM-dependent MidA family methyltransferase